MRPMPFLLLGLLSLPVQATDALSSLGAHVFVGQPEGLGANPATTPAVATQGAGSIFIAFNAGYADNTATPTDNYSNRWKPLDGGEAYAGYGGAFMVRPYVLVGGRGGPAHSVSIAKAGHPSGELSLSFVEVIHANRVVAVARNYASAADTVSSDTIDVDGPATLLAFWWGDGGVKRMDVAPDDGFQVIDTFTRLPDESGVQGLVAWKQLAHPGHYPAPWHVTPAQAAPLWLIATR